MGLLPKHCNSKKLESCTANAACTGVNGLPEKMLLSCRRKQKWEFLKCRFPCKCKSTPVLLLFSNEERKEETVFQKVSSRPLYSVYDVFSKNGLEKWTFLCPWVSWGESGQKMARNYKVYNETIWGVLSKKLHDQLHFYSLSQLKS